MVTAESPVLERHGRLKQLVLDLWEISRPGLFMVSIVPFWFGYLLASRQLIFGQEACGQSVGDCASALAAGAVGLVVWGPLVWLAVLAINDAYDLEADRLNPRKDTPLTSGRLSERGAKVAAYGAAATAVALSYAVRPGMALATLGFLVCGWIYSVPPLKWKNRAGFDVLSNCLALGVFPVLGGWAVARPLDGFPWIMALALFLVQVGMYMPTMIGDCETDRATGSITTAVRFGQDRAYQLGLVCWTGFWAMTVALAALDEVYPRELLWFQLLCTPLFVWLYHRGLGRAREPRDIARGMIMVGRLFLLPLLVFALVYSGTI
ncbi:hypothetical protein DPM19_30765 [Actinomadura craniellae]|uniref:Prenyltransferase n=1 Tax=Actinomadura craniellae TaxID=2231787 RepID=A0A365GXB7_9ACTN|nr:UbiA family prenyltransferase [Actinomadura craniellae]RAY11408.1 hypothetical protein DPM19_30765 [Actinomadura craniellae]